MNITIKTLVALLPLFITSCYNDDTTVTTNPQQDRVVTINAGITREGSSTTGSPFANNDKILITNVTRKNAGLICNSAVFTYDGSSWTSEGTLLWSAGEEENIFQAVYPSTASYSSFTVPSDQSDADKLKSADWMTCETKVTLNNLENASSLDLTFNRKMAMVVVLISGADVSTLTSLKFECPSFEGNDYTINSADHKINAYKTSGTYDASFSALIPPGTKGETLCELEITDSDTNTEIKSLKLQNTQTFSAGKKYTFTCNMPQPSNNAHTRSAAPDNLTLVSVEPIF